MKIMTMGSPASNDIFNQKINEVYNGNYEVQRVRNFYTIGHLLSKFENIKKFAETIKENNDYYKYLTWNYEQGGFWGKLRDFQPDLLVIDLFTEVYFGSIRLKDGTLITRNFRLSKNVPNDAKLFTFLNSNYIQEVMEQVIEFKERIQKISPQTKLIFNGAKFPKYMSKNGVIQGKLDKKVYKISESKIDKYNKTWASLDDHLEKLGFVVLKFDQENNAAELNFPTGKRWYYLYNQNYYTEIQSQIEKIAQENQLGPTVSYINLDVDLKTVDFDQDVIFLRVPNEKKDLQVFKKNLKAKKIALFLASKDYVLHGNYSFNYRFVKRKQLKTQFPKFKDVHYRVIPPKENKQYGKNKLLVRMLSFSLPNKTSMIERNFRQDFLTLKDSIVKNTFILEIGDINLIGGSFYTNTKNFPDFENQIQELIKVIAKKNDVEQDNVVLYGGSRGAMGAIYHAALGNYKFIVADPAIDGTTWYLNNDSHWVGGVREIDLTNKVITALQNYHREKDEAVVIGTSNVGFTFAAHLRLPLDKISLVDLNFSNVYKHPEINAKSVPIQLSYINYLLFKDTIKIVSGSKDLPKGVVFEVKHLAQNAINFEKVDKFRVRISDILKNSHGYEIALKNIEEKYSIVYDDKKFKYFKKI